MFPFFTSRTARPSPAPKVIPLPGSNSSPRADRDGFVHPTSNRQKRIEPEVMLFCYVIRGPNAGRCERMLEMFGQTRSVLGKSCPMWSIPVSGRSDDELLELSVADAKAVLEALRSPVDESKLLILDDDHPAASMGLASRQVPVDAPSGAHTVEPRPALVVRGVLQMSGPMPWRNADGTLGKPSFAIVLRDSHGRDMTQHGSDLDRALRESGVQPGDEIVATKFPAQSVRVGNRVVRKNIWTVEKVQC